LTTDRSLIAKITTRGVTASATSVKRQFSVNIIASMPTIVRPSISRSIMDVDAKSCTALMSSVMVLISGPTCCLS
jgi:hypothetical protein